MDLFFELIQVALQVRSSLSTTPTKEKWMELYDICQKQAMLGIAYAGIELLPQSQKPDLSILWPWSNDVKSIEEENLVHQKRCKLLLNNLYRDGFNAIIIKGQSLLPYYPKHLQNRREPGDIDVWVTSNKDTPSSTPLKQIIDYAQRTLPNQYLCYIHYDFHVFSDVEVELHIRPSFVCNPFYNHRLQKWFRVLASKIAVRGSKQANIDLYTTKQIDEEEQAIILLLHIYKHMFETGIGFRQLLDLHLVLCSNPASNISNIQKTLKGFGVSLFFDDIIYVLHHTFKYVPKGILTPLQFTPLQIKRGEFLLKEIVQAGNFGHHDARINHQGGQVRFAWEKLKHNLRLMHYYPQEVLWEPFYRLYHWIWRTLQLWRFE